MKNITPFMVELHKELKEKRDIAEVTASQYIRTLYSLNSGKSFINLAWLKNIESVESRLSEYAESTQKTMLSTIVSTLSLVNQKSSYKKIFAYWYNKMMDKATEFSKKDTTRKTEKQEENWLSWDVVLAHESRLEKESAEVLKKTHLGDSDWDTLLSYMVLSLYTQFPPRRNQDYQLMKVVKNAAQAKSDEYNYYIEDSQKFVFNKYKTAKAHGEQSFDVPADLVKVINRYLSKHPEKKRPFWFLVSSDGTKLSSVNAITRILNRIFGKNVGATMLRHIYLSSKYDVEEMNRDADEMGHSAGMQRDYMKGSSVTIPTIDDLILKR
jgi:hypothetical protein